MLVLLFECEGGTPVYRKSAGKPGFRRPTVPVCSVKVGAGKIELVLKQPKSHTVDTSLTILFEKKLAFHKQLSGNPAIHGCESSYFSL